MFEELFPKARVAKPCLRAEVPVSKQRCSTDEPNSENKFPPGSLDFCLHSFSLVLSRLPFLKNLGSA